MKDTERALLGFVAGSTNSYAKTLQGKDEAKRQAAVDEAKEVRVANLAMQRDKYKSTLSQENSEAKVDYAQGKNEELVAQKQADIEAVKSGAMSEGDFNSEYGKNAFFSATASNEDINKNELSLAQGKSDINLASTNKATDHRNKATSDKEAESISKSKEKVSNYYSDEGDKEKLDKALKYVDLGVSPLKAVAAADALSKTDVSITDSQIASFVESSDKMAVEAFKEYDKTEGEKDGYKPPTTLERDAWIESKSAQYLKSKIHNTKYMGKTPDEVRNISSIDKITRATESLNAAKTSEEKRVVWDKVKGGLTSAEMEQVGVNIGSVESALSGKKQPTTEEVNSMSLQEVVN